MSTGGGVSLPTNDENLTLKFEINAHMVWDLIRKMPGPELSHKI
jgi:hypothetical protein